MLVNRYEYINICWEVEYDEKVKKSMSKLFDDYYLPCSIDNMELSFKISLVSKDFKDLKEILEYGHEVTIHNSKKPSVHEEGLCYDNGFTRTIYNLSTKSVYYLNYLTNIVTIYNKDISMLSRDGIRVIRDLVKVCTEEKNKAVMFHAAALRGPKNQGVLLLGGKGSGKTTFSLNLLYDLGFTEVSRDRVFIEKQRDILCIYGWPNYYNLTMRTIRSFEKTKKFFPSKYIDFDITELDNLCEKIQFTPDALDINNRINKAGLTHVIFLANKNKKGSNDLWDILAQSCYSPKDLNYPDWHSWVKNTSEIYKNAKEISKELVEFKNTIVLEWDSINDGIEKILYFLEEG